jgi:hypothetical protein
METIDVAVSGGTPGADSSDYTLFDSTVCFGAPAYSGSKSTTLKAHGITRIEFTVKNSQAGTLTAYFSKNSGTTWTAYDVQTVAAAAANTVNGPYDYLSDPYPDIKLVWTNGGVAQATWIPVLSLIRGYHGAAT